MTYAYTADGLRIQQSGGTAATTTNYTVDPESGYGDVVEERDGSGNVVRYDYGDDLVDMRRGSGNTVSYYVFDGQGSTRQITSSTGAVTDTYGYDAYGNTTHLSGNTVNPYLCDQQCQDGATRLYYLRARYMDDPR